MRNEDIVLGYTSEEDLFKDLSEESFDVAGALAGVGD